MPVPTIRVIDLDDDAPEVAPEPESVPAITKEFLFGGKAYWSVTNPDGKRMSYTIQARAGKRGTNWAGVVSYYLRVFYKEAYRYVGVVQDDGVIVSTGRAEFIEGTLEFDVAQWALLVVCQQQTIRAGYSITHNDKCGRCARPLVVRGDRDTGFHLDCAPPIGEE
jgi:hypothetical protein